MSTAELYEIMVQLKGLYQIKPDRVRSLLLNNPAFAYSLLKTQVILGLITPDISKQLPTTSLNSPLTSITAPLIVPTIPPNPLNFGFPILANYPFMQAFPFTIPLLPGMNQPTVVPSALPADALAALGEDQRQLLEHVMQLTPEEIEKLQPQERLQIMQLRQAMMSLNWSLPRNNII